MLGGRTFVAVVLAVAGIGVVVAGGSVAIGGSDAQASPVPCDSWANPISGNWQTATNWSTGAVPTASDNACITASEPTQCRLASS